MKRYGLVSLVTILGKLVSGLITIQINKARINRHVHDRSLKKSHDLMGVSVPCSGRGYLSPRLKTHFSDSNELVYRLRLAT